MFVFPTNAMGKQWTKMEEHCVVGPGP